MSLLAIKDTELEESNNAKSKNVKELMKLYENLDRRQYDSKIKSKRPLEFNQATKQIEPLEYIYICTTEHYQRPTQVQSWWSTNI